MPHTPPPQPPDSLPNYLSEGLPKQDSPTLQATIGYLEALLKYRERQIEAGELPADADPVGDAADGRGTVVKERVKCGDQSCRCMKGGEKHGPYLYRYYREGGRLKSEYVGKAEAA
jgi:hypothetical protein